MIINGIDYTIQYGTTSTWTPKAYYLKTTGGGNVVFDRGASLDVVSSMVSFIGSKSKMDALNGYLNNYKFITATYETFAFQEDGVTQYQEIFGCDVDHSWMNGMRINITKVGDVAPYGNTNTWTTSAVFSIINPPDKLLQGSIDDVYFTSLTGSYDRLRNVFDNIAGNPDISLGSNANGVAEIQISLDKENAQKLKLFFTRYNRLDSFLLPAHWLQYPLFASFYSQKAILKAMTETATSYNNYTISMQLIADNPPSMINSDLDIICRITLNRKNDSVPYTNTSRGIVNDVIYLTSRNSNITIDDVTYYGFLLSENPYDSSQKVVDHSKEQAVDTYRSCALNLIDAGLTDILDAQSLEIKGAVIELIDRHTGYYINWGVVSKTLSKNQVLKLDCESILTKLDKPIDSFANGNIPKASSNGMFELKDGMVNFRDGTSFPLEYQYFTRIVALRFVQLADEGKLLEKISNQDGGLFIFGLVGYSGSGPLYEASNMIEGEKTNLVAAIATTTNPELINTHFMNKKNSVLEVASGSGAGYSGVIRKYVGYEAYVTENVYYFYFVLDRAVSNLIYTVDGEDGFVLEKEVSLGYVNDNVARLTSQPNISFGSYNSLIKTDSDGRYISSCLKKDSSIFMNVSHFKSCKLKYFPNTGAGVPAALGSINVGLLDIEIANSLNPIKNYPSNGILMANATCVLDSGGSGTYSVGEMNLRFDVSLSDEELILGGITKLEDLKLYFGFSLHCIGDSALPVTIDGQFQVDGSPSSLYKDYSISIETNCFKNRRIIDRKYVKQFSENISAGVKRSTLSFEFQPFSKDSLSDTYESYQLVELNDQISYPLTEQADFPEFGVKAQGAQISQTAIVLNGNGLDVKIYFKIPYIIYNHKVGDAVEFRLQNLYLGSISSGRSLESIPIKVSPLSLFGITEPLKTLSDNIYYILVHKLGVNSSMLHSSLSISAKLGSNMAFVVNKEEGKTYVELIGDLCKETPYAFYQSNDNGFKLVDERGLYASEQVDLVLDEYLTDEDVNIEETSISSIENDFINIKYGYDWFEKEFKYSLTIKNYNLSNPFDVSTCIDCDDSEALKNQAILNTLETIWMNLAYSQTIYKTVKKIDSNKAEFKYISKDDTGIYSGVYEALLHFSRKYAFKHHVVTVNVSKDKYNGSIDRGSFLSYTDAFKTYGKTYRGIFQSEIKNGLDGKSTLEIYCDTSDYPEGGIIEEMSIAQSIINEINDGSSSIDEMGIA